MSTNTRLFSVFLFFTLLLTELQNPYLNSLPLTHYVSAIIFTFKHSQHKEFLLTALCIRLPTRTARKHALQFIRVDGSRKLTVYTVQTLVLKQRTFEDNTRVLDDDKASGNSVCDCVVTD